MKNKLASAEEKRIRLYENYKYTVKLVHDLRVASNTFMKEMADFDEDISADLGDMSNVESGAANLLIAIKAFNAEISERCDSFSDLFEAMIEDLNEAYEAYEEGKGELSLLLERRKQVIYLNALINKFKSQINGLQLMNNMLLSLSPELDEAKNEYKSNLIYVSTAMTAAFELGEEWVRRMEKF